jgi:hypothetical protein
MPRYATAGITGHQTLAADITDWIRSVISEHVTLWAVGKGVTSLAAGADQLFAELLCSDNIPYDVVIPCRDYETTFTSAAALGKYERLKVAANTTITLDFGRPSEEAFLAAGEFVVRRSNVLFAVWDGEPAKGRGGTADVVSLALSARTPVFHINSRERTAKLIA